MDFRISEAGEKLRHGLRGWIDDNLPDAWRDVRPGSIDEESYVEIRREWGKTLHAGGWSAPTWPAAYGGLDLSVDEQVVYLDELVRAGAPEPLNSNPIGVFGPCLMKYGTPEQKEQFLGPMLRHELVGCQGFSEPDAGSDLSSLRTSAVVSGDGYELNGQKVWTTNAQVSDFCYILVRTQPRSTKGDGLTMMAMGMHQPGVTVRPLRNIAGTDEFNEVFLDNAFVPAENVIGPFNRGWEVALYALSQERTTGIAQRALRLRRDLDNLIALDNSIGSSGPDEYLEGWRRQLDSLRVSTRVVESIVYRNLSLISQGEDLGMLSPMVILTWSKAHQELRRIALERFGTHGVEDVAPFGSWYRSMLFARSASIAGGTSEIQLNNIARALGLPSTTRV
jgi:alkylation response protein AidB-like acyl-CoA dehydrogenase